MFDFRAGHKKVFRSSSRSNNGPLEIRPFAKSTRENLEARRAVALKEYGFIPNRQANIVDGSLVPAKLRPFSNEFYGTPLEELDHFIYEKVSTFKTTV